MGMMHISFRWSNVPSLGVLTAHYDIVLLRLDADPGLRASSAYTEIVGAADGLVKCVDSSI